MAEKPASERTEQPTQRKLDKAREKGQVAQSQEMPAAVSIAIIAAVVFLYGPSIGDWFVGLVGDTMNFQPEVLNDTGSFMEYFGDLLVEAMMYSMPFLLALAISSIAATLLVSGFNFSAESLRLKFDEVNPIKGFEKLFNVKSLVKLGISVLKLIIISAIAWFYIRGIIDELAAIRWAWTGEIVRAINGHLLGLLVRISIGLVLIAALDMLFQKWKYIKDLMMTRQEVKEEHKDTDGSPEVKSRIRKLQMEMSARRMLEEVPEANVVLVNPTHYSVAIKYDPKTMDAPLVVAKGADNLAQKIREIARAYGVPIVSKPELTRTIYRTVDIDGPIPQQLYMAVAEIMAMVYRMRQRRRS